MAKISMDRIAGFSRLTRSILQILNNPVILSKMFLGG
jgi:hypothetical protein